MPVFQTMHAPHHDKPSVTAINYIMLFENLNFMIVFNFVCVPIKTDHDFKLNLIKCVVGLN